MSLQFRSTTQREPGTVPSATTGSLQNHPINLQPQHRRPTDTISQDSSQGSSGTMPYAPQPEAIRGRGPRENMPAPINRKRSQTLRPQRRSFDNISNLSNQPDVGSGSDIGGRARAPVPAATASSNDTSQSPTTRRPTVFYPSARLAPSRQTYSIRKRSQSQGMSTDNLLDHRRHRSSRNPESDSELSSSELSTSTQATTVASDDESVSRGKGSGNNRVSHRSSLSQTVRPPVPYPCPRDSAIFHPNTRGSSTQLSPRESSVQFSEPLESSVRFRTPSTGAHKIVLPTPECPATALQIFPGHHNRTSFFKTAQHQEA
ncbi:hypothetical protein GE09DRAFT_628425 [Coniochaeta sp. 2T2.1]|nr:hypothetical protein GE09DRAFT_628425 [Coniochaeta sp. 2T2.1]